MKRWVIYTGSVFFVLLATVIFFSCQKNTLSKIPIISLNTFYPADHMRVNVDIAYINFSIVDGDADIGNDTASAIYLKDSRFENLGFVKTQFPQIDGAVEDPNKGLKANCTFYPVPQPEPRLDSIHLQNGDTIVYEFYITDRAHHESNHIITHPIIVTQ